MATVERHVQSTGLWGCLLQRVSHQPAAVSPVGLEGSLAVPLHVVVVDIGLAAQLRVCMPAGWRQKGGKTSRRRFRKSGRVQVDLGLEMLRLVAGT